MRVFDLDADVYFGEIEADPPDWREDVRLAKEEDPDDESLVETPADVVDMLGFDPLEL